jgi:hypothetical protein
MNAANSQHIGSTADTSTILEEVLKFCQEHPSILLGDASQGVYLRFQRENR